ncbi:Putative sensor (PAS) domain for methyl-accepting chemotaxis sensory transducer [Tenacibaculum maritimum]|uniref:PAS domain-containing protein n=1 Tax=Tenacibaculum maritimum TaxID=107401 RepID=UPI0012E4AF22|nr:PAS domain-containing protein [Tenacibaculum maritimum]CAA0192672.1 Putative sensor (PAS) domain for methyl-accepting chemotaxis sensory transducer [Tenacibaculum maritimum]CAA0219922.1 Putative sensor (PAS) domain for methyl-accepting chemotaxis sensory transducer [Tenacibaculum maritimum]CAA0229217.1 Putative sensor (PAS) domain for methyl-accepting chemotaxis sensory transducer [Tenacibaculum maritimum]
MKTPPKTKTLIDEEVTWDKTQTIISKTDPNGTILYTNEAFLQASEYSAIELIGEPHNVIRHPDMPKVTFKILWEALKKGKNFHAIVKNLTKTGRYYWVITDFTTNKDENGNIIGYTGRRKAVPEGVVERIEPLYKTLLEIEQQKGEKVSELYFKNYLEEEVGKDYDTFVVDLFNKEVSKNKSKIKKGLNWFFLGEYK